MSVIGTITTERKWINTFHTFHTFHKYLSLRLIVEMNTVGEIGDTTR